MNSFSTRSLTAKDCSRISEKGRLYAILDACDEPETLAMIESLDPETFECLFGLTEDPAEKEVAPYLARVNSQTLNWLMELRWGEPWGIFVIGDSELRSLRQHLRGLLSAVGPDKSAYYFRYYDPRVLIQFLPTCNDHEIEEFFGPVQGFGVTNSESGTADFFLRL